MNTSPSENNHIDSQPPVQPEQVIYSGREISSSVEKLLSVRKLRKQFLKSKWGQACLGVLALAGIGATTGCGQIEKACDGVVTISNGGNKETQANGKIDNMYEFSNACDLFGTKCNLPETYTTYNTFETGDTVSPLGAKLLDFSWNPVGRDVFLHEITVNIPPEVQVQLGTLLNVQIGDDVNQYPIQSTDVPAKGGDIKINFTYSDGSLYKISGDMPIKIVIYITDNQFFIKANAKNFLVSDNNGNGILIKSFPPLESYNSGSYMLDGALDFIPEPNKIPTIIQIIANQDINSVMNQVNIVYGDNNGIGSIGCFKSNGNGKWVANLSIDGKLPNDTPNTIKLYTVYLYIFDGNTPKWFDSMKVISGYEGPVSTTKIVLPHNGEIKSIKTSIDPQLLAYHPIIHKYINGDYFGSVELNQLGEEGKVFDGEAGGYYRYEGDKDTISIKVTTDIPLPAGINTSVQIKQVIMDNGDIINVN